MPSIRCTSIFPGMISLRNEENYDNTETTDTPHTPKGDASHNNQEDSIENVKYINNTNDDEKYKEDISKIKTVMKVLITLKL